MTRRWRSKLVAPGTAIPASARRPCARAGEPEGVAGINHGPTTRLGPDHRMCRNWPIVGVMSLSIVRRCGFEGRAAVEAAPRGSPNFRVLSALGQHLCGAQGAAARRAPTPAAAARSAGQIANTARATSARPSVPATASQLDDRHRAGTGASRPPRRRSAAFGHGRTRFLIADNWVQRRSSSKRGNVSGTP